MTSASLLHRDGRQSARTEELGAPRSPTTTAARHDLRVLLAIAAAAPSAEQAITQLSITSHVRVDVVRIVPPGGLTRPIWQQLHQTLAGCDTALVDHYVLEDGDPADGIARYCRRRACDLIMAPPSRRHLLWLPWQRSTRAAILRQSPVPVWTTGTATSAGVAARRIRRVGCCLSLESGGDTHLQQAIDFSDRVGARLHLLHVVPPLDDGSIGEAFDSDRPLAASVAHERAQALIDGGIDAEVGIAVGAHRREVHRLVRSRAIDVLCISSRQALYGRQLSPALRALPCPVLCCPGVTAVSPSATAGSGRPPAGWSGCPRIGEQFGAQDERSEARRRR